MERESLTALLGQGLTVEKIARRFGKHPSTVAYWMEKYGLEAPNRERHAAKGGIEEAELRGLVEAGMSIAEIARTIGRSKASVRHWLSRYGLRTRRAAPRESRPEVRAAREAGLGRVVLECPTHGSVDFVREGRGYYRCTLCPLAGGDEPAPAREGDPRGGGRRGLRAVRLRSLPGGSAISPSQPGGGAIRGQRAGAWDRA